jgi:nickel-dependent lactate racemase
MASAAEEEDVIRQTLELDVPEENLIAEIYPKEPPCIGNVENAVEEAIKNPFGGEALFRLLSRRKSLAIVVDNQFRPTPTAKYLRPILDVVEKAGVKDGCLAVGGMMVSHAVPMSEQDLKAKLGAENLERLERMGFEVFQNEPKNIDAYDFMGFTKLGTPVWFHKKVARCDIKLGLPFTQASEYGYAGGGKLALAMCSEETIEINHRFTPPLSPEAHYGALKCAWRVDIDNIAELTKFNYALNTILSVKKMGVLDLTYGELPDSYHESIRKYNEIFAYDFPEEEKADIVIVGTPAISDHLFFHTVKAVFSADLVCKDGGTIIFCTPCPGVESSVGFLEGFSWWKDLMSPYMPPTMENLQRIVRDVYRGSIGLWSGCIWIPLYEVLTRKDLKVVTLKENLKTARETFDATSSVQEAFEEALKRHGKKARVVFLPYAKYQLPRWAIKL